MLLSLLIVGFVLAYAIRGWRRGLVVEVIELAGIIAAAFIAFLVWPAVHAILDGWAAAFGGAVIFALVAVGATLLARAVGRRTRTLPVGGRVLDGSGGTVFAATWSGLLATALLLLALTVPGARLRSASPICDSTVARMLVSEGNPLHGGGARLAELARPVLLWVNQQLSDGFTLSHGDDLDDLCENLPDEGELASGTGSFTFPAARSDELATAPTAEDEILALLNQARAQAGLAPVAADAPLREVGRQHSLDMYLRGYFAHETPECRSAGSAEGCTDPFERMKRAGITYRVAGENLALAPTSQAAHQGLMDSPGHRANILNPEFTHVGIGVIQGPYGLMVSQEFTG